MAVQDKPHWTLDRRVPVTLILTLAVQTASVVWWARGQQEQMEQHGKRLDALELQRQTDKVAERLAVIEYQLADQKSVMTRIEAALLSKSDPRP